MRVLVLGVTGMLGSAVYKLLAAENNFEVCGTARTADKLQGLTDQARAAVLTGIDVLDGDVLIDVLSRTRPEVIINCVGLIKQLADAEDPVRALPLNALLPHRLARLAALGGARVIHVSTDCVFSGRKGGYVETDIPDAEDVYGKSKQLGELSTYPHAVTLRTSIIGHEQGSKRALLEWFLAQEGGVQGYTRAVFSGLPTTELARVMRDHVIPVKSLQGLYHVSAAPIDKCFLLRMVARVYDKEVEIVPDDKLVIDRSLNSDRFRAATGYQPRAWIDLLRQMQASR